MILKPINFKDTIINLDTTIKEALSSLVKSQKKICLVIDKKNNFIGAINDGDIRRALLKNLDLKSPIRKIINYKPLKTTISDNLKILREKMILDDIWQVPIINKKKITGLLVLTSKYERKILDSILYIPAGGFGKRMGQLTEYIPKPMLQIKDKPIIQHIIENAYLSGFKELIISLHYKSNVIKKFIRNKNNFGLKINFIDEKKPLGTCGSLANTLKHNFKQIVVHNGDVIGDINYNDLLNFHLKMKNKITTVKSTIKYSCPYGVIKFNKKNLLTNLNEKPIYNYDILSGIYVFDRSIIQKLKKNKFISMTDFLQNNSKRKISVYDLKKQWNDIGKPIDIIKVNDILKRL